MPGRGAWRVPACSWSRRARSGRASRIVLPVWNFPRRQLRTTGPIRRYVEPLRLAPAGGMGGNGRGYAAPFGGSIRVRRGGRTASMGGRNAGCCWTGDCATSRGGYTVRRRATTGSVSGDAAAAWVRSSAGNPGGRQGSSVPVGSLPLGSAGRGVPIPPSLPGLLVGLSRSGGPVWARKRGGAWTRAPRHAGW